MHIKTEKNYFVCRKTVNGNSAYSVLDSTGKAISSEFSENISVYGELILSGKKVYNFDGKQVIDGEYSSIETVEDFENYYFLKDNKDYETETVDVVG